MEFKNAKTAIKFLANSFTYPNGKVVSFNDIELKTVLISASQASKIVKTEIQGADGACYEYIGKDNYYVTITGVITGDVGVYPLAKVLEIKKMLETPVVIDVVNDWLQNLGIYQLVIESHELPQMAGGISYQNFTLYCTAPTPIELRISNV